MSSPGDGIGFFQRTCSEPRRSDLRRLLCSRVRVGWSCQYPSLRGVAARSMLRGERGWHVRGGRSVCPDEERYYGQALWQGEWRDGAGWRRAEARSEGIVRMARGCRSDCESVVADATGRGPPPDWSKVERAGFVCEGKGARLIAGALGPDNQSYFPQGERP